MKQSQRGVMTEKVWVRTCYPNDPPIPMAMRDTGTHALHEGILGKHRFYIAPGFTLLCHHPGNTNAARPSNIYSRVTHTVVHKWTDAHTNSRRQCVTSGRLTTSLTSVFLSPCLPLFRNLSLSMNLIHPAAWKDRETRCLKKRKRREKVNWCYVSCLHM